MDSLEQLLKDPFVQITLAGLALFIAVQVVNKLVHNFFKRTDFIEERKEKTIESLIRSITKYVASIGFIFFAISRFVTDLGGILAGAGIAGIVIGFGAQSLIRDILAGVFLIYEKQLHQGDFVTINNTFNGTVEEIGLRSMKVREWSGKLLTISNGEIKQIHNYNFEKMRVIERIVVSYKENPARIFELLNHACGEMNKQLDSHLKRDINGTPLEPFQVYGMTSLNAGFHGYEYTITGLVEDRSYFEASKEARKIIAQTMYDHNIQMAEEQIKITHSERG